MQSSRTILHSGGPLAPPHNRWTYVLGDPVDEVRGGLDVLPTWQRGEPTGPGEPPFQGGWVGHVSYDAGRSIEPEKLNAPPPDDLGIPHVHFTYHRDLLVHDRLHDRWHTIGKPHFETEHSFLSSSTSRQGTFTRDDYEAAVRKVIGYIAAGDIFQANLTQRFTLPQTASAATIFRRLLDANPAPYGALLDRGDYALVSNSPELYFRLQPTGTIDTRPIKGTRPNAVGMHDELLHSAKDAAELNMIVDLERNDFGRVCRVGSVRVSEPRHLEDHGTVLHGVANVTGELRPDASLADIFRATFPGGSVTGAPKIRAMQILDELEPVQRGPYCGAIGYVSDTGHACFNLAIRTIVLKNGSAHVSVGGGIVADSVPADEYEETLVKAKAMFAALDVTP